ncbi:MAG: Ltp family lipoprotein [Microthrixaceae bacterium]|nr:Ltp family lipoprotein [Microthrixaceae bacterium]
MSLSQQQAIRAAESYLDYSGFSRQGLIDQLSSEYGDQFSVQDATAAVDSLNVDYDAEAVESAESYLDFSSFSCQGLIDQLSSEFGDQFTIDQATRAAGQVGLC